MATAVGRLVSRTEYYLNQQIHSLFEIIWWQLLKSPALRLVLGKCRKECQECLNIPFTFHPISQNLPHSSALAATRGSGTFYKVSKTSVQVLSTNFRINSSGILSLSFWVSCVWELLDASRMMLLRGIQPLIVVKWWCHVTSLALRDNHHSFKTSFTFDGCGRGGGAATGETVKWWF